MHAAAAFGGFIFAHTKKVQITQSNGMGSVNVIFMDNTYYTPCARHSFPPSPVRETRVGVPGRPEGLVALCSLVFSQGSQ